MWPDGAPRPTRGKANRLHGGLRAPDDDGFPTGFRPFATPSALLPAASFPEVGFTRRGGPSSLLVADPCGAHALMGVEGSSRTFNGFGPDWVCPAPVVVACPEESGPLVGAWGRARSHGPPPSLAISMSITSYASLSRPASAKSVSSLCSAPSSHGVSQGQPPKILQAIEGPNGMPRGRRSVSSPTPCEVLSEVFRDPPSCEA